MPPSTATFVRRFRRLDREARLRFVAALFAAQPDVVGVETEGSVVVVARDSGTERVAVGPPTGDPVDIVVVAGGWLDAFPGGGRRARRARRTARVRGATVLGPTDLHDRLLYAVDRGRARQICRAHLGLAFDGGDGPGAAAPVLAVAAAALLGLALVAVSPVGQPPLGGPAVPTTDAGVDAVTLRDPAALADAHRDAIRTRVAVRMNATFAGPRHLTGFDTRRSGYDPDDVVRVRVRAVTTDRYRSVRETAFAGGPLIRDRLTVDRYADGDTEYVRISDDAETRYKRQPVSRSGTDLATGWSRELFPRYLTTNRTRVERLPADADARYRVVTTGSPRAVGHEVRDYRAIARVAADGLVTRLSVGYVHPGTGARVSVTARFGSADAAPTPRWYETARDRAGSDAQDRAGSLSVDPDRKRHRRCAAARPTRRTRVGTGVSLAPSATPCCRFSPRSSSPASPC